MAELPEPSDAVARFAATLTPYGRWYAALSVAVCVMVWCLRDQGWVDWPTPVRCGVWTWLTVSVAAPGFLLTQSAVAAITAFTAARSAAKLTTQAPDLPQPDRPELDGPGMPPEQAVTRDRT